MLSEDDPWSEQVAIEEFPMDSMQCPSDFLKMGNPPVTMLFNAKMVIHYLDLGSHFRKPQVGLFGK